MVDSNALTRSRSCTNSDGEQIPSILALSTPTSPVSDSSPLIPRSRSAGNSRRNSIKEPPDSISELLEYSSKIFITMLGWALQHRSPLEFSSYLTHVLDTIDHESEDLRNVLARDLFAGVLESDIPKPE